MPQSPDSDDELVTFYKALADANRLKIVGALAHKPYSVEELAALLSVRPSTVSHHLTKLAQAGLVSARAQGYYSVYQLEAKSLEQQAHRLLKRQDFTAVIPSADLDAYDRKVVADYSRPDGSLKTIPARRKKLEAVLQARRCRLRARQALHRAASRTESSPDFMKTRRACGVSWSLPA